MAWVVTVTPRIHFGPPPSSQGDIDYLKNTLHVNCIVNLRPKTGRYTKKDHYDTAAWYQTILGEGVKLHHIPLSEPHDYIHMAQKVYNEVYKVDASHIIYVHHTSGFLEEGYVALCVWRLTGTTKETNDPCEWLKNNNYEQVFDSPEKQELMQTLWKECYNLARMRGFFTKKSKTK